MISMIYFYVPISHFSIIFIHFSKRLSFLSISVCLPFFEKFLIIGWSLFKPIWIYINRGHYSSFNYPLVELFFFLYNYQFLFNHTSVITSIFLYFENIWNCVSYICFLIRTKILTKYNSIENISSLHQRFFFFNVGVIDWRYQHTLLDVCK